MLVNIKIPDDTYEAYGKHNSQNPRFSIEKTLERFAHVGHLGKAIVVNGETLSDLQTLAGGTLDTPEALLAFVKKALSVKIDGIEVALTPSQRKGVGDNAAFFKRSPEDFLRDQVKRGLQAVLGV